MSFFKALKSAVSAVFGVQTQEQLEQDFSQSNPLVFIFAGLVVTALFIGTLVLIASFIA